MSKILNQETIASGKFLELQKITFENDDGKIVNWQACQRKNNANAVSIVALLIPSYQFVFVKEFRAPVGKYCIGNPAGIIEEGQDVKKAAIRQLKEETGYTGKIVYCGVPAESSAGLTGELTTSVFAFIDENLEENKNPIQHLDGNQKIEIIKVHLNDLPNFINEMNEQGICISSKIVNMVIGSKLMFTVLTNKTTNKVKIK